MKLILVAMWWKLGDVGSRDDMDEVIIEASKRRRAESGRQSSVI